MGLQSNVGRRNCHRLGFTLIELLVVISIVQYRSNAASKPGQSPGRCGKRVRR
ncbi:type II secretion system protein [Rhodopirellula sp. JC639]|uniref:type II secretion system protein n=1 Tax=Stieleria mannarensis TaxID=2755585 RepID=UPI00336A0CA8